MEPPAPAPANPVPPLPGPVTIPHLSAHRKIPLPLLLVGGLLLVLVVLVGLVLALRPRSPQPLPVVIPPPVGTPAQSSDQSPTPAGEESSAVSRLPLTTIRGHTLLLASGSSLWSYDFTPEGPRKSLYKTIDGQVADLSLSPSGRLLAVTFAAPSTDLLQPPYPKTGLTIIDLTTNSDTVYIPLSTKAVRYPAWSADSQYLAVWNDGQSIQLFDMTTKTPRLEVVAPSGTQLGPPVFVPRRPAFSYVENGTLYESDYLGKRTEITQGITSIRTVQGSRGQFQLPNPHLYSPNSAYIVFHDTLGQLILFYRGDASRQILAEWAKDQAVADKFSYGAPVFFDPSDNLIYYDLRKSSYQPGIDDNPLNVYQPAQKSGQPFFSNPKIPIYLVSMIPGPAADRFLVSESGFRIFRSNSAMLANCEYTGLTYAYYSGGGGLDYTSPLKVWSPDSRFIFSIGTNQVADTTTCSVSVPFDSNRFEHAIWIK